jgi:rSAM/selenodomain-associated transferase 2/rSAM/selenodomain-associated transferase 1
MDVSVVIPTLNEAGALPSCIGALRASGAAEIVVSDGGSTDGTLELAQKFADKVVHGPKGRGGQLRRGTDAASGTHLLFLHADARVPFGWTAALVRALAHPGSAACVFKIRYDAPSAAFRVWEDAVNWRGRLLQLYYGDHGIAVSRATYDAAGGFPDIPLMEDVEFCRALRKLGRIELLDGAVTVSTRRQGGSPWLNTLRNTLYLTAYSLGAAPEKLYRRYYNGRKDRRTLLLFLKAPVAGKVKTRLAAELGPERARDLYIQMAREVAANALKLADVRLVCCYEPSPEYPDVSWLSNQPLEWWPQASGDLGDRLAAGFRRAFELGADRAAAIGADSPGLPLDRLSESFEMLDKSDIVLGPAEDGGFYLISINGDRHNFRENVRVPLFSGVPWSSGEELAAVRHNALTLDLSTRLLGMFYDLDEPDDLRRWRSSSVQPSI